MIKKTLSFILTLAVLLTVFSIASFPAGAIESGSFEYKVLEDGTAEITDYNGDDFILEIPSEIDGYTVTSIGDYAFYDKRYYKKVIIPNTVVNIGKGAFAGSDYKCRLQFVELPASLRTIGDYAFLNCGYMMSVMIPAGISTIGSYAFGYFYQNKEFSKGDQDLFSIYCYEGTAGYSYAVSNKFLYKIGPYLSEDENYAISILSDDTLEITEYFGTDEEVTIPSQNYGYIVSAIGPYAFSGTEVGEVSIPETVTLIDLCAFYNCECLYRVEIPEGVMVIEAEAFENCPNLTSVDIPLSVIYIGTYAFGVMFDEEELRYSYTDPETLIRGYHGTAAEEYANELRLPFELITYKCGDYNYTLLNDGTAAITAYAGSEKDVYVPTELDGYSITKLDNMAFILNKTMQTVHIPSGVTTLGLAAFYGCTNLKEIYLPDTIELIRGLCFVNCTSLNKLYLPHADIKTEEHAYGYNANSLGNGQFDYFKNENITVFIYQGGQPEAYCKDNDINYTFYSYGDVDCDGVISMIDATYIQRAKAGFNVPERFNELCAIVNNDKEINIIQVTYLQRYIAKLSVPKDSRIGEPVPNVLPPEGE